jgi:hypothetical protein
VTDTDSSDSKAERSDNAGPSLSDPPRPAGRGPASASWRAHVAGEAFEGALEAYFEDVYRFLERSSLNELLPEDIVLPWISRRAKPEQVEAQWREPFNRAWARARSIMAADGRQVREVLGEERSARLVSLAERLEPPPEAVRAVFRQGATEKLLGEVLYEGIMGFLKRADLLGPVVDKLPILGGLRRRLLASLKEEFERRAETKVRSFLQQASKAAVERAIEFVLSDKNRELFKGMRHKLAQTVLDRRVRELAGSDEQSEQLREEAWRVLVSVLGDGPQARKLFRSFRERYGDRTPDSLRRRFRTPSLEEDARPLAVHLLRAFSRTRAAEERFAATPWPNTPGAESPSEAPGDEETPA